MKRKCDPDNLSQKDLRRLSRKDLLNIMLKQSRQIEELKESLTKESEKHKNEIADRDAFYEQRVSLLEQEITEQLKKIQQTELVSRDEFYKKSVLLFEQRIAAQFKKALQTKLSDRDELSKEDILQLEKNITDRLNEIHTQLVSGTTDKTKVKPVSVKPSIKYVKKFRY